MNDDEYLSYKSRYGQNEYDFELDLMNGSSDLLSFIAQGNKTLGEISNGAVLVISENQYILTYNRGMGQGTHDLTLAKISSILSDNKELNISNSRRYCSKLEKKFLHARLFSEKESQFAKLKNIISFSFNRDSISEKEYNSFLEFCNEYEFIIKKYHFDVSFKGKTMSFDTLKERLKSIIDYNLEADYDDFDDSKIIGIKTNDVNMNNSL